MGSCSTAQRGGWNPSTLLGCCVFAEGRLQYLKWYPPTLQNLGHGGDLAPPLLWMSGTLLRKGQAGVRAARRGCPSVEPQPLRVLFFLMVLMGLPQRGFLQVPK